MNKKKPLRLYFADMWKGFDPYDNYFIRIFEEKYEVQISAVPDLLIYSCFGLEHLSFNCHRFYFSAESQKTPISTCDFSISFESLNRLSHYQLPYAAFWVFEKNTLDTLTQHITFEEALRIIEAKEGVCSLVVSNSNQPFRNDFFNALSSEIEIASGGKFQNNVGGPVKDKDEFISKFIFNICFENETKDGYLTEKIVDSILANCIPIYWGDPLAAELLNPDRIIFVNESNVKENIDRIVNLSRNKNELARILSQPVFLEKRVPDIFNKNRFYDFLFLCAEKSLQESKGDKTKIERFLRLLPIRANVIFKKVISKLNVK